MFFFFKTITVTFSNINFRFVFQIRWRKQKVVAAFFDTMSDGVDGGGGENEVDSHSSSHAELGDSINHREEENDPDNEAALNTNYDSGDGAVPVFR